MALLTLAASATGAAQVTPTGTLTVFDTTTDVNVRADSGNTTLTLNGVTLAAGGVYYATNSSAVPTGPISMQLSVSNTTVNAASEGGINVFTNVVEGNDITVQLASDVSVTSGGGSGGVWVRNEKKGAITLTSAAAVNSSAGDGVTLTTHDGNISLNNSGAVTASTSGARALYADSGYASTSPVTVSMVNSGTLNSDGAGMRAINYKGTATIENSGTITSATRQGLIAWSPSGDVSITNQAAGVLTANAHYAIQGATQVGNVTVVNHGQATGLNGLNGAAGFDTSESGSGNVTITNTGSVKATGGTGILASTPSGNVTITNSGTITSTAAGIDADSQSGTVSITNSGSITGSSAIKTGSAATTIVNSGTISGGIAIGSGDVTLELRAGSSITGNVAKSGSTSNTNTLALGGSADASFDLTTLGNSAQYRDFSNLNKTGASTWNLTGTSPGFDGHVNVQNGTLNLQGVLDASKLTIESSGGAAAALVVDGQGASLTSDGVIQISRGTGTQGSLTLRNGAKVETVQGSLYMGAGGTVDLSGSGTTLRIGSLHSEVPADWVSADGWFSTDEGTIRVTEGARLHADGGYIGGSGSTLATMTVDGSGTVFQNDLSLYVGGTGNGTVGYGKLTVSGGASVTSYTSALGVDTGSEGTLVLSGAGTTYTVQARTGYSGNMRVGYNGTGTATVENGASLTAKGLLEVASQANSRGTMTVQSGGQVSAGTLRVGVGSGSQGSLAVNGTGSSLTATAATAGIGVDGQGSLTIGSGGLVTTQTLVAGWNAGGTGTVEVTGADSRLNNTSDLFVGVNGTGTLTVASGGSVTTNRLQVATEAGSTGTVNIGAAAGQQATGAGTLNVGKIELGAGTGRVVLNHTGSDYTLAAGLTGAGAVDVLAGTTTFAGDNSSFAGSLSVQGGKAILVNTFAAASAKVNANGTLQIGAGEQAGNLAANLHTDGLAIFANSSHYSGRIGGQGLVSKIGTGTVLLSGDSSGFAGTANVAAGGLLLTGKLGGQVLIDGAGTLQVGDGTTNGDLLADTTNNGTLIFNQTGDYDYTGALSGNGNLIKQGSGLLLLSGDYHYTGSTVVQAGLVRLAAALDVDTDLVVDNGTFDLAGKTQEVAGLSGTGGNLLLGNGSLTVNQSSDSQFAGSISGTELIAKEGAGTLNLTGVSTFTGRLAINEGLLAINGVLPGSATVNDGGRLGGNGTVGSVTVHDGGVLTPGNSIGQLYVTGDVTFNSGSVYAVEVDADGNTDHVNATGRAVISGGTVAVAAAAGNYRWFSDYVILRAAGGVSGQFDGYSVDLPFLTPSLSYSANDVVLTLARNDRQFASFATTPNQRAVAGALDGFDRSNELYRAIAGQADADDATHVYDSLSGELWATAGTFMIDRTRRVGETMLARLEQADAAGSGVWVQGLSSRNKVENDGNAAKATQRLVGVVAGFDTVVGALRLGGAVNQGTDKTDVDDVASRAEAKTKGVAFYAGRSWDNWRARLGVSHNWHEVTGTRNVNFTGVTENLEGRYDARSLSAFGEVSYGLSVKGARVEPFAGLNRIDLRTDGFAETGGELVGLGVDEGTRDVTYGTLGLRLSRAPSEAGQPAITPRLSLAWLHGFGEVAARSRHHLPAGDGFTVSGLPATRNALRVEGGADVRVTPHGALGLSYVGNFSSQWSDHGLRAGFSYSF